VPITGGKLAVVNNDWLDVIFKTTLANRGAQLRLQSVEREHLVRSFANNFEVLDITAGNLIRMSIGSAGQTSFGTSPNLDNTYRLDVWGLNGITNKVRIYSPSATQAMFMVENSGRQWGMICMESSEWWLYDFTANRVCLKVDVNGKLWCVGGSANIGAL
jgi:hypothetical protein